MMDASGYEAMLRTKGAQDRLDNLVELRQSVESATTRRERRQRWRAIWPTRRCSRARTSSRRRGVTVCGHDRPHTAKGLEFPFVFLYGKNEGLFPSRRIMTLQGMEEERRLAFVAMTRSRDGLFISCADGKNFESACATGRSARAWCLRWTWSAGRTSSGLTGSPRRAGSQPARRLRRGSDAVGSPRSFFAGC